MSETEKYTEHYTRNFYRPDTANVCKFSSLHEKGNGFMSKIFTLQNNRNKEFILKMPFEFNRKSEEGRILSPHKVVRLKPIDIHYRNGRGETFLLKPVMNLNYPELEVYNPREGGPGDFEEKITAVQQEMSETEKLPRAFSRDNPVLEMVSVEDRGTDPWYQASKVDQGTDPYQRTTFDRGTDPIDPSVCTLPACQLERKLLENCVREKEKASTASFQEGCDLLKEMYKIKEAVCTGEIPEEKIYENPGSADELIKLSYTCLKEISTQLSLTQKLANENTQYLTDKLTAFERRQDEAAKDKAKIKKLKLLFSGVEKHEENIARIRAENKNLMEKQNHVNGFEDKLESLTDHLREFNSVWGAHTHNVLKMKKVGCICLRPECPFGSNYVRQTIYKPGQEINTDITDSISQ